MAEIFLIEDTYRSILVSGIVPGSTSFGIGGFTQVFLHFGHWDPVSSNPVMSWILRSGLAAVSGIIAVGIMLLPVHSLQYGYVPPAGIVALTTGTDFIEVSAERAVAGLVVIGVVVGAISTWVGIALFGLIGVPVLGIRWLSVQTVVAGGIAIVGLFTTTAYVVIPRYADAIHPAARISRQWLVSSIVFGLVFVLAKFALFSLIYG